MTGAPAPHPVRLTPPDLSRWRESATGVAWVQERAAAPNALTPGPELLLTALVHGNEFSGALVLDEFLRTGLSPRQGRITVAFCNMRAFQAFDAACPDASRFVDEDFNRVWSAQALDGPGRSAELARAREIRPFARRCSHLLDLHSMHEPCTPLLVTGLLPHNIAFARRLACAGQIVADEGHADGLRLRDYEETEETGGRDRPPRSARIALLLEAGQHWAASSVDHARDVLARFLVQAGAFAREDLPAGWWLPDVPAPRAPAPIRVTHRVVARSMDFRFLGDFQGGEIIARAGTAIALDGGEPVITPYDGCVLVMPSVRQLRPGVTTVRLGRHAPPGEG